MSEILYIQTEKNVEVQSPEIYLQDVAKLTCKDSKVLNRNKVRKVFSIPNGEPGRYVVSAVDLVHAIAKEEPNVDITHIGEANLVVTYEKAKHQQKWYSWLKTLLVCVLTFFGGAFSIMTFNTDVDTANLFSKIYTQFTGEIATGPTILEFTYSVGIGIGVVFFFNHFGKGKLTQDPTPVEVQMRLYEDDVNKTLIADKNRSKKAQKGEND
ncbi:stage V sporulation protein AA [Blautia hansenii]|uniref:stage V sporulation protein AA n=1 Tax=Blautia hansenii TaxID=1322 RepID=UPI0039842F51